MCEEKSIPKHVVILGGSGQVATALKERLILKGSNVSLLGTSSENDFFCDLRDAASIKRASESVDQFDGLVLNAKKDIVKPIQYRDYSEINECLQVGISGPLYFIGQSIQEKKLMNGASIVSIGSQSQLSGLKYSVDYSSVKSALHGMNKSLIKEFARKKIRSNTVIFDWIDDGKLPKDSERLGANDVSGFANPHEACFPIEFLLSSKSRWISGQSLLFDGGRFLSRL